MTPVTNDEGLQVPGNNDPLHQPHISADQFSSTTTQVNSAKPTSIRSEVRDLIKALEKTSNATLMDLLQDNLVRYDDDDEVAQVLIQYIGTAAIKKGHIEGELPRYAPSFTRVLYALNADEISIQILNSEKSGPKSRLGALIVLRQSMMPEDILVAAPTVLDRLELELSSTLNNLMDKHVLDRDDKKKFGAIYQSLCLLEAPPTKRLVDFYFQMALESTNRFVSDNLDQSYEESSRTFKWYVQPDLQFVKRKVDEDKMELARREKLPHDKFRLSEIILSAADPYDMELMPLYQDQLRYDASINASNPVSVALKTDPARASQHFINQIIPELCRAVCELPYHTQSSQRTDIYNLIRAVGSPSDSASLHSSLKILYRSESEESRDYLKMAIERMMYWEDRRWISLSNANPLRLLRRHFLATAWNPDRMASKLPILKQKD